MPTLTHCEMSLYQSFREVAMYYPLISIILRITEELSDYANSNNCLAGWPTVETSNV